MVALFGLALLGPSSGDAVERAPDGVGDLRVEHNGTLAAILVDDAGQGEMQDDDNRLIVAAALLGKPGFEPVIFGEGAEQVR